MSPTPPGPDGAWDAVGTRIVQARKRAGLDQRALGELVGLSDRHVRNIEHGETNPFPWITAISAATQVDADWLEHGDMVKPGELTEAAGVLREALAELRADREVLVRATETNEALTETLRTLIELLAARLAPPRERP